VAKPSVLVLTSTFPRWANDTEPPFVFELCRRLAPYYDLHVLAPHCPGSQTSETVEGMHVHRFRYGITAWERLAYGGGILPKLKRRPLLFGLVPLFLIGQFLAAVRLVRRYRVAVVHAHWILPQGLIAVLSRRAGGHRARVVCTVHGGDLYGLRGALFDRLRRIILRAVDHVTVVSRVMQNDLMQDPEDTGKISVIPMGVDLRQRFTPGSAPGTGDALLFVGRLVEKKGLRYLLEAMPAILDRCPSASLRIVGSGPEQPFFERLARQVNIHPRVSFLGAVPNRELPPLYRSAGVLVFPSVTAMDGDQEGFGLVLVEALGCGCACVVTDLPAMMDIADDNRSALVVSQKDPQQLAEAISTLLSRPELRSTLAAEGRAHVLKNFDWDVVAARYLSILRRLEGFF
jgi:glycosyltransferase involved in cell wall biosynthesis